jgi:anti-sigma-K factor RskA
MSANSPNNPPSYPGGPRHSDPADLALYAMQLLSNEDASTIAHHLGQCPQCSEELARIYSDLATCALAVDLEAPPVNARQRLLQQVAREKKIVPIEQSQSQAQPQPHSAIADFGRSGSVLSIDEFQPRPRRSILAFAGWAVAAVLAVAVALQYKDRTSLNENLAAQSGQIARLTAGAASAHQLLDALTDPRAVRVSLTGKSQPKSGPSGGITYNPEKGTLIFLASNLDPLQAYKTYELWVIPADGTAPIPAGTFHPDDQGDASVILPELPKGVPAKAFGVTIEEDGGSQTPTLPIIMAGS